jgi:hypothetical protein
METKQQCKILLHNRTHNFLGMANTAAVQRENKCKLDVLYGLQTASPLTTFSFIKLLESELLHAVKISIR